LDLHIDRSHQAFAELGKTSVEEVKEKIKSTDCFVQHEKGLISDDEFRNEIRNLLNTGAENHEIDAAWSAMLGDVPADRLNLLAHLRKDYKIFLLSNTNAIHVPLFSQTVKANMDGRELESFFDKVYYSHVIRMRKPDPEIYTHVLDQSRLNAGETLFLDDFKPNLDGAEKLGINTFHVQGGQSLFNLFS